MHNIRLHWSLLLIVALSLLSCDRTPRGVMSINDMANLIVDLQLADAYIETHNDDFQGDSSKLVVRQSIFKKHGITQQDYDSSLVWYAHNMEDYTKAYDKAVGKLKERYDKLDKNGKGGNDMPGELMAGPTGEPTHDAVPQHGPKGKELKHLKRLNADTKADSVDLWRGRRNYTLTQGVQRGFITFDLAPDAHKQPGDRYQFAYKLLRGGNEFKVCLSVDYTDGATSQITRSTNSDGWVAVDVQSDSARQVRRVYGYVSYDIKRGHTAFVDSLTLMRTRMNTSNYGLFNAQRLLKRKK